MKKIILIVMAVGCILVMTINQVSAATTISAKPLVTDISGCVCGGGSDAYRSGCNFYMIYRLQLNKTPGEAALNATNKCEMKFGPTKPNATIQCKEGVNFLRGKE